MAHNVPVWPLLFLPQVFHASLKLLGLTLNQLIPGLGLGRAEVTHCLEQTFPNLLTRTGDSNNRLRVAAITLVQVLWHTNWCVCLVCRVGRFFNHPSVMLASLIAPPSYLSLFSTENAKEITQLSYPEPVQKNIMEWNAKNNLWHLTNTRSSLAVVLIYCLNKSTVWPSFSFYTMTVGVICNQK